MTNPQYKKDDLVWAKVEGYSWWPAVVAAVEKVPDPGEPRIIVNFIGEDSHAILPPTKIAPYREKYSLYSKTKKKYLLAAIDTANKIESGEVKYTSKMPEINPLVKQSKMQARQPAQTALVPKKRPPEPADEEEDKSESESQLPAKNILLEERAYLLKLLGCSDPRKILKEERRIRDCLDKITHTYLGTADLANSGIGHLLQKFVNKCAKNQKLESVLAAGQKTLQELKNGILIELFGVPEEDTRLRRGEETNNTAEEEVKVVRPQAQDDIVLMSDSGKSPRQLDLEGSQAPPIAEELKEPKDKNMWAKICQEIAKHLEEV